MNDREAAIRDIRQRNNEGWHTREDVEWLLAELAAARAEIAQLTSSVNHWSKIAHEQEERERVLRELAADLIAYSNLRGKVRLREDPSEYEEAEKLIARFDALAAVRGGDGAA